MRFLYLVVLHAFITLPLTAMAETPAASPLPQKEQVEADSVRVQPRANDVTPNPADEDAVQKRITIFNSTQEMQDESFDKKLSICRGC